MAPKILYDFHQQSEKDDSQGEKITIIEVAVKLIKNDIKSIEQSKDRYITADEMNAEKTRIFSRVTLYTIMCTVLWSKLLHKSFFAGAGCHSSYTPKSSLMFTTIGTWCATSHPDWVVQYAADNVDHNPIIIDGLNTFHCTGMIATIALETKKTFHRSWQQRITAIICSMVGKCVLEHSFKKKYQVVTMAFFNAIKICDELMNIDSQLLF